MKNNVQKIGIALIIGSICRYVFFIAYGYLSYLIVRFGIEKYVIMWFPKAFSSIIYTFVNLVVTSVVIFISVFIPAIIFGYVVRKTRKLHILCSVFSFIGIICFDIFYYVIVLKDAALMINNYLPVWYGILIGFIWIVLFYMLYSFGNRLGCKWQRSRCQSLK